MPADQPPAGWYSDPSNPTAERWWGGSQWGAETRPLVSVPPTAPPHLMAAASAPVASAPAANTASTAIPGMSIPGMSISALALAPEASAAPGASPTTSPVSGQWASSTAPASTIGTYIPPIQEPRQQTFSPAWYNPSASTAGPPPANSAATRSLAFGIVSWFFNPLAIFSLVALSAAKRGIANANVSQYERGIAIGRSAAYWGRGLATASLILTLLGYIAGGWAAYRYLVYDDGVIESQFAAAMAASGAEGSRVDCPEEGSYDAGSSFDCTAYLPDGQVVVVRITVNNHFLQDYSYEIVG